MKRIAFILCIVLASSTSMAAGFRVTSEIKSLFLGPQYGSKVFIEVANRPTTARPPGCTDNANFDFVLDLNHEHAKEYYSALLAAYAAGKTIQLESYNDCSVYGSVPGLKTIFLR